MTHVVSAKSKANGGEKMTLYKTDWGQILKDLLNHILPTLEVQEPGRLKKNKRPTRRAEQPSML